MTNVPDARGREPLKDAGSRAEAAPLFPSEGTFSAVVPLSQVGGGRVPARPSAANAAAAPGESEEEATLVPTRLSSATRARRASAEGRDAAAKRRGRHWLATAAAVLLSVTAGVAAGAYLVWTRQAEQARTRATQASDAADASRPAPEVVPTETKQAATPDAAEAAAPSVEVVKVERAETVEKPAAETVKPDPASRREAVRRTPEDERRVPETEARAARRTRASAETFEATHAPKPRREEAAPRRQATPARPSAAAASGRTLPVSSPPPSARSRTVIQWP